MGNLTLEGLVMKMTMGITIEGTETLVDQYHAVKGIEATHPLCHIDVVEVVGAMEAEMMVEMAGGIMGVMASQTTIKDHHGPPTAIVGCHGDTLCPQQTQLDIVPPGYTKQLSTTGVACTSDCIGSYVST